LAVYEAQGTLPTLELLHTCMMTHLDAFVNR
jgi:hypothetical protein